MITVAGGGYSLYTVHQQALEGTQKAAEEKQRAEAAQKAAKEKQRIEAAQKAAEEKQRAALGQNATLPPAGQDTNASLSGVTGDLMRTLQSLQTLQQQNPPGSSSKFYTLNEHTTQTIMMPGARCLKQPSRGPVYVSAANDRHEDKEVAKDLSDALSNKGFLISSTTGRTALLIEVSNTAINDKPLVLSDGKTVYYGSASARFLAKSTANHAPVFLEFTTEDTEKADNAHNSREKARAAMIDSAIHQFEGCVRQVQ